jgi:hypothetical protein
MPNDSSTEMVYGARVKNIGSKIVLHWNSPVYSHIAAYFGYVDNRVQILRDRNTLFVGFADGAPNIVGIENPDSSRRLFFVLFDPRHVGDSLKAGDVFSIRQWPKLSGLTDIGGNGVFTTLKCGTFRIKMSMIYLQKKSSSTLSASDKHFMRSLGIRRRFDMPSIGTSKSVLPQLNVLLSALSLEDCLPFVLITNQRWEQNDALGEVMLMLLLFLLGLPKEEIYLYKSGGQNESLRRATWSTIHFVENEYGSIEYYAEKKLQKDFTKLQEVLRGKLLVDLTFAQEQKEASRNMKAGKL